MARDAALEASRAKSMFLANMSHEIRTPLTTVLATAEILEDTPLDNLQLTLLAKMHRSGELLKTLVEGILDFSRIEAGKLELASTAFDLHAMVADAADVYSPRAIQAGIRFEWHLDPSVPRTVVGDPSRLFQVLTNLLDNALKFTHQGQVRLIVRRANADDQRDGAGEVVEFMVDDTGIGIREEDQASVFESFMPGRRLDDQTLRRQRSGAGDLQGADRADGRVHHRPGASSVPAARSRSAFRWPAPSGTSAPRQRRVLSPRTTRHP